MFNKGEIWAYPTDTSFGLGVRCDDGKALQKLAKLKGRDASKYFSLMVKDWEMLEEYARIPKDVDRGYLDNFAFTLLLKPKKKLPMSQFWPKDKVGFRVCNIPQIKSVIEVPVTATSANFSGDVPIYSIKELKKAFGDQVQYCEIVKSISLNAPSQIWDYTENPPLRLR